MLYETIRNSLFLINELIFLECIGQFHKPDFAFMVCSEEFFSTTFSVRAPKATIGL